MAEIGFQGLIVGLGNPGLRYLDTPHNFGFLALESFLKASEDKWAVIPCPAFKCELWRGDLDGKKWLAAKPLTYMNLSGDAVGPLARWYKLAPEHILIVQDELDLPWGRLKFKKNGGAAGHKGILSISNALGSNAFFRLRIGIGRPGPGQDSASYVLRRFSESERIAVAEVLTRAVKAISTYCLLGPMAAMQALHAPSAADFV
ncbi:MAG TPA: aminoacyl-tRNA hydrolase [Desulfonatronum sp.]|nr:aminoacyl-tRNA hydrolase [Desulfonatronum sp.]